MLVPQHVKEAVTSEDGLLCTDGGTRGVNSETLAGWSVIARSPRGTIDVMFGPVVTV